MLSCFSRIRLFATLWAIGHQAPLSMGFPRQEHWSGLPCPPPGDLPDPGIKPTSLMSPALAGRSFATGATWEAFKWENVRGDGSPCLIICVSNMGESQTLHLEREGGSRLDLPSQASPHVQKAGVKLTGPRDAAGKVQSHH